MKVVVADDQRVVRDGLVTVLEAMPGVEVVGAAADGAAAVATAGRHGADVVLMDLRMPGVDGVAATAQLREQHPSVRVVVLTTYDDDESIFAALQAGAVGFLTKNASRADIHRAIEAACAGQSVVDASVQARLVRAAATPPVAAPEDGLTDREAEVLALVAEGLSNQEIAARLYVGESTVKTHINRIYAKTGCRDRPQAIAYANRRR